MIDIFCSQPPPRLSPIAPLPSALMVPKPRGSVEQRFWSHVERRGSDECWLWNGSLASGGYGRLRLGGRGSQYEEVHRFAYRLLVGEIPDGHHIHHRCETRSCVNPAHLEALLPGEHLHRGASLQARFAQRTHCKHGHEFTPENTFKRPTATGTVARGCRACRSAKNARQWQRRKEQGRLAREPVR